MKIAWTLILTLMISSAHAAEITGRIQIKGKGSKHLNVGFIGRSNGQPFNCGCGSTIGPDAESGSVSCLTFKPMTATMTWSKESGCTFRHEGLTPGSYFVYVKWDNVFVNWKIVHIKSQTDKLTVDLPVDPSEAGAVRITVPDKTREYKLRFTPVDDNGKSPYPAVDLTFWLGVDVEAKDGVAHIPAMHAGDYQVQVAQIQRLGGAAVYSDIGSYRITVKAQRLLKYAIPAR